VSDSPLSIRARRKYKAQIEQAARENHIAKFNQRMELAKAGVDACKRKDFKVALQYHHAYLEVLEKAKGGDLTPKSFDPKHDAAEMLMLTGVYWDLAKIYDKLGGKNNPKLKLMLAKFVLFSKGMNYQRLSQEMLRKFLTNGGPNNRALFKEAFVKLGGGRCFIATAVEEHCEVGTILVLKRFRDEVLLKNSFGRVFVRIYYGIGPIIAIRLIRSSEKRQKRVADLLGRVASAVSFRFFPDGK
jgi:hypothetical protein